MRASRPPARRVRRALALGALPVVRALGALLLVRLCPGCAAMSMWEGSPSDGGYGRCRQLRHGPGARIRPEMCCDGAVGRAVRSSGPSGHVLAGELAHEVLKRLGDPAQLHDVRPCGFGLRRHEIGGGRRRKRLSIGRGLWRSCGHHEGRYGTQVNVRSCSVGR